MITLQHAAIYMMAVSSRTHEDLDFQNRFMHGIQWVLLPDAIRAYIGPRQMSHFEQTPDGAECSWLEFPEGEVLKLLTKDTALHVMKNHMNKEKYPKCVIGEDTHIEVFDRYNYGHQNYHELRIHLLQDVILDEVLRDQLVCVEGRFEDRFALRCNPNLEIDGIQLREQVKLFEEWGFLHLVGKIWHRDGILLNQEWFKGAVYDSLMNPYYSYYPEDLAENTYKFMQIPAEIERKINSFDFEPDIDRIFGLTIDEIEGIWDQMYARALRATEKEIS